MNRIAPCFFGSMRRAACWPTRKRAVGGDRERLLDLGRIELDERPAGAEARIVDHDLRRTGSRIEVGKQLLDVGALAGVAGEDLRADLFRERLEIIGACGLRAPP